MYTYVRRVLLALATIAVITLSRGSSSPVQAQGCGFNRIVCENQLQGNPSSEWDISGSGDANIQGFATAFSVAPGDTQQFKISSPLSGYTIDIYRMGYYGGMGARNVATIPSLPARSQLACLTQSSTTGLIDCGNWTVAATWDVPANATSGIYFAKLKRTDTGGASHIFFVVRDDVGHSDMLFQTSDTTWQAYNSYGGNSLYTGGPGTNPGRAYKVSYNRPFTTRGTSAEDFVFNAEYPMVRWLEMNGFDVSYFSGIDTDRFASKLLEHKVFLSVGHDEYWSGAQRANVEAARGAGVNLAFFSGNAIFWKTRWETSIDGSATAYRTLVSYKETHANAVIDPAAPIWTGTWRDARFSPPGDGGRPENALMGTIFRVNDGATTSIVVPSAQGKQRFWRNTSIATLAPNASATLPFGTLGYEWDEAPSNNFTPAGLMRLSSTTANVSSMLLDNGSTYGSGTVTHNLTLYRHASGALVFGAGTVQWPWGLDSEHDRGNLAADVRMKQATANLFADMGVQAQTLEAGLTPPTASSDVLAPTSTITSPSSGASIPAGTSVTISGTATENGGGVISGVAVSVDGGATWLEATGTTSWSYVWTASGSGPITIRSRAVDDSGNIETPSSGVGITITAGQACPCTIWSSTSAPSQVDDGDANAVEIGTRFRSDVSGYVTAIRFYKGSLNTGTHTGRVWTNTGTLLGSVTFTGETATGWQQATLPSAIPISANTTYVVSYHAPNGHYPGIDGAFATSGVDNPPLHALRDGLDGSNGVYRYGSGGVFPTNTYASEAYWVDVVLTTSAPPDTTPPTVTALFPSSGAANVDPAVAVTATFSEAMDPTTISSSTTGFVGEGESSLGTFELRDPTNALVRAAVTYDINTRVATLRPDTALALSTTYTAIVKGGATDPRVKDLAGNPLAVNKTWTFTTAATAPLPPSCPCTIWTPTTVPPTLDDGDTSSVELGTRFRSDTAGYITGARFYKSSLNTGTHIAKLWTNAGGLLGSVTFSGETATGWQEATFAAPIAIAANTTYVISYHANNGHYAIGPGLFAAAGVDRAPLHALRDGEDGPNGLYQYGTSAFPTQSFQSDSYFVDVVFNTSVGPDTTPPTVTSVGPIAGMSGVRTNTTVSAAFSEAMTAASITTASFFLRDPANNVVPASVSYSATTKTATLTPSSALAYSTQYTAVVKGGATDPRVKDVAGNALAADYTWTFTTAAPPPPPPTQGPGGPVLVITSSSNPFSTYLAEILRTEGLNAFATADLSTVTSAVLSGYDAALLGETPLTADQVTMLTDWVTQGGNLIAMRPDKQLAGLLGLIDAGSTLSNGYLLIDTAASPGAGLVSQTIQFHGVADRYTLDGATRIATLYSTATAATVNPAITMRSVGTNGGHAVAFTYDLGRSVVYTRQGNPAWSGQERDGQTPIRSDDLYFGAKSGDLQNDWVDLNKVAIPQADEQQRLLWNILLEINSSRKPLPRFWYLPRMLKAAIVMTGDDHGYGGTAGRFDHYLAQSAPNCSVDDWGCIRGTSYLYPSTPLTAAQITNYVSQGFELALHVTTQCTDYTSSTLENFYATQLAQFATNYPQIPAPSTNRTHCIAWSDYATQPQTELAHAIRLDTTYYYWPGSWVQDRPGMFTGSGMPMRYASLTGALIDVYQVATQMTDESSQTYPLHADALLDKALGLEGYYGVFTANMHTDSNPSPGSIGSDAIIGSAQARGVPVITAKQLLDWLDGRNGSSFANITWGGNVLGFDLAVGAGATGLNALVPSSVNGVNVNGITLGQSPVTYTVQTIKGVSYAVFTAQSGHYAVSYGAPLPTLAIGDTAITEGNSGVADAVFSVTLSAASTQPVTVNYATANGSALAGSDYTAASGTLTFNPGETVQTLTVSVTGDTLSEGNETFTVNLSNPVNAGVADGTATGTILNDDPVPSISISDGTIGEGNSGAASSVFNVTLSSASGSTIIVNFATASGTASAGTDFVTTSGTLTFTPGTTTQSIAVPVLGDTTNEADELFSVNLSGAVNATIAKSQGSMLIVNDDPVPSLAVADTTITEGNSGTTSATVTVTLSAASGQTVTVSYATANGTATAGSDYTATSGTLTFTAGATSRTFTVSVTGETTDEPNETILVDLSSPTNATLGDAQGIITISNDDAPVTGLVAAYGFGEGSGTTAADSSGRGHTGSIAGATWTTQGKTGNALSFDGVNDMVSITSTTALQVTRVTMMAWVRPTVLNSWNTIVLKETSSALAYALYANDDVARPAAWIKVNGADKSANGTAQLPLNTWTHVAATFDGSNVRLYVNGVLVKTRAANGNITTSTQPLRIGGNSIWGEWYAGLLDDVRIYNRALTQAEIQTDMNTPVP